MHAVWFQRDSVPHAPGGASGSPRLAAPVVGSQPPAGGGGAGAGARWMTCPAVLVRRSWCNLDSASGPAAAAGGGGCLVCAMRVRCAASRSGTAIAGSGTLNPKAELRDVGCPHGALTNVQGPVSALGRCCLLGASSAVASAAAQAGGGCLMCPARVGCRT